MPINKTKLFAIFNSIVIFCSPLPYFMWKYSTRSTNCSWIRQIAISIWNENQWKWRRNSPIFRIFSQCEYQIVFASVAISSGFYSDKIRPNVKSGHMGNNRLGIIPGTHETTHEFPNTYFAFDTSELCTSTVHTHSAFSCMCTQKRWCSIDAFRVSSSSNRCEECDKENAFVLLNWQDAASINSRQYNHFVFEEEKEFVWTTFYLNRLLFLSLFVCAVNSDKKYQFLTSSVTSPLYSSPQQ